MSLPTPPLRSDGPATFADRGDAFLAALPQFEIDMNAAAATVAELNAAAAATVAELNAAVPTIVQKADAATAAANFKGLWTAQTGAMVKPASVYHNGAFWALNTNLANVTTATPGVSASWTRIKVGADVYAYDSRATLRTQSPPEGEQAIIDGLGLFVWQAGSTEPDDDESCFATASGAWLLQAAAWDLVDAWQAPDDAVRDEFDEDQAAKMLTGSATCAITSVANISSASFTGIVTGAAIGDRVIATPPAQLGTDAASTGRLSYHAWVSAANTVTIMLTNASAATTTTNAAIQTTWPITVIKA